MSLASPPLSLRGAGFVVALFLVVATALPADAASCFWDSDKSPSRAAPQSLWNGLSPTEPQGVPPSRDTSDFNTNGSFSHSRQFWRSIDSGDGYLLAGYNLGIEFYSVQGANEGVPNRVGLLRVDDLPILWRNLHDYFLVTDVDFPDGESDIALVTGWDAMGFVVVDSSNKSRPRVIYQDGGESGTKYGYGVYATRINGRLYGFMAAERDGNPSGQAGVWMYDLTTAQQVGKAFACTETRPTTINSNCNGVFQRKLSTAPQNYIDGAGSDNLGHFLAFSGGGSGTEGVELWDVSTPSAPQKVVKGLADRRVDQVAMWQQGSKLYLAAALRFPDEAAIYDVSCLASSCSSNPLAATPVYSFPMSGAPTSTRGTMQISENGGVPYLHVGRSQSFKLEGLQSEWLLDVSDPANPVEVAGGDPKNGNVGQPTIEFGDHEVGYWSWYHACNDSGTNNFESADGRVMDGYFYRAGGGILDAHKMKDVTPRIQVQASVTQTYQDTGVAVSASALNCTPSSGGWSWDAGDGVVSGSGASVTVSWPTTGSKTVSATNSACSGSDVTSATVSVKQAAPAVGSVTSDVSEALACSPVTFTANSVTGKPTLSHSWEVLDAQNAVVATLAGGSTSATWDTSALDPQPNPSETYRARYTVNNTAGSASKLSGGVLVNAPGDLGFTAPIGASISFGDVDFQANATGATEWRWTFGDGNSLTTTDPTVGPAPEHRYDAIGTYDVTVEIRNCVDTTWQISEVKQVTITEVNPLVVSKFQARKNPKAFRPEKAYTYETNSLVTFELVVEGDPEIWEFDWDGDGPGTFEVDDSVSEDPDKPHTYLTSHTYSQAGEYRPVLRVRRGAASQVEEHGNVITVIEGDPPSISLAGSSSAKVGNSATFRATATNCTPAATWNWSASGGGQITGDSFQVTIRWNTTGNKTVSVSNSGCGSASATKSVNVTSSTPPPPPPPPPSNNDLEAIISVSAVEVEVGEEFDLDGSNSRGAPSSYTWEFGDGETGSGSTTSYAYGEAGLYTITLTVSKPGDCSFGYCSDDTTKQIRVIDSGPQVGGNGCEGGKGDDGNLLCLDQGRFEVEVAWRDHHNGNRTGVGGANSFGGYEGVTGSFWFFNPNSVDLIVKVLGTQEGDHWVFYGGLSDVYYEMTVTDTETGEVRSYENLEGSICGLADTTAFLYSGGNEGQSQAAGFDGSLHFPSAGVGAVSDAFRPGLEDEEEEEDETSETLSLLDGRFDVTIDWINQHDNDTAGIGTAIPGTNQVGYFWFFNERNLEVVIKMVDGRAVNDYWWVFWGGLSDVNYTIKVVDVVSGREWTRTNPPGSFCGGSDTTAFKAD